MDLYGACSYCDKLEDCIRRDKPSEDCPVETFNKAWYNLKQTVFDELKRLFRLK